MADKIRRATDRVPPTGRPRPGAAPSTRKQPPATTKAGSRLSAARHATGRGAGARDIDALKAERAEKDRQFKIVAFWISLSLMVGVLAATFVPWSGGKNLWQRMFSAPEPVIPGPQIPNNPRTGGGNNGGAPRLPSWGTDTPQVVQDYRDLMTQFAVLRTEVEPFTSETEGQDLAGQESRLPQLRDYLTRLEDIMERREGAYTQMSNEMVDYFFTSGPMNFERDTRTVSQTTGNVRRVISHIEREMQERDNPTPTPQNP